MASQNLPSTSMYARYLQTTLEVDELLNRAKEPPADISERNAWGARVKEDCLKLVKEQDRIAADMLEVASSGIPGTMVLYRKVAASLECCATCIALVDLALMKWTVEQSFHLGSEQELGAFAPHMGQLLDKNVVNSVAGAAEKLNAGVISCSKGYCIAYSSSNQAYYALYRSDKRAEALDHFGCEEVQPPLSWKDAAGRKTGDDGYNVGDLKRICLNHGRRMIQEWTTQDEMTEGCDACDLMSPRGLLQRILHATVGGSSSFAPTDAVEISHCLQEKRSKAYDLLRKCVMLIELRQKDIERVHAEEQLRDLTPIHGVVGRKYRKGLYELEQNIRAMPMITPEFVHSAASTPDLDSLQNSIESMLKLAEECEDYATHMDIVASPYLGHIFSPYLGCAFSPDMEVNAFSLGVVQKVEDKYAWEIPIPDDSDDELRHWMPDRFKPTGPCSSAKDVITC